MSPGLYQESYLGSTHRSGQSGLESVQPSNGVPLPTFNRKAPAPSADFHSFATSSSVHDDDSGDYQYDIGFVETDRIDVQSSMDPSAILYSQQALPYGEQFPSFQVKTLETRVGSSDFDKKTLVSGDNVVYGKGVSMPAVTEDNSSDYYEDEFYYDYYEDGSEYKSRIGMASPNAGDQQQNENPMSFFQLLNNLNGSS